MTLLKLASFICLVVFSTKAGEAQGIQSVVKSLATPDIQAPLKLDSLSIVPNSLQVFYNGNRLDSSFYILDPVNSKFTLQKRLSENESDSLTFMYNRFLLNFKDTFSLLDRGLIQNAYTYKLEKEATTVNKRNTTVVDNNTLSRSGSISRGISVGNNQNLAVNSNLDLQLNGQLTDDVELIAALSDRNIPIQPEGTTSNIQEFDQVFVRVQAPKTQVTLGDFFIESQNQSYFFKTFKKSQGVSFQHKLIDRKEQSLKVGSSIGVARGKFARLTFNGDEGNQGPYRLTGQNGELNIMVIAGTERVFVNGKQLQRGEQNEYTIDYNTAELIFTPNQLITAFDRIVVEFQYADNSYERIINHGFAQGRDKKLKWQLNFYQEQDNRNKPFYTDLNQEDIVILSRAGDDLQNATKLAVDSNEFTENSVRYYRTDTVVDGRRFDDVYVQTSNEQIGKYRLTFSYVGEGRGNYIESRNLLSRRAYEWVAPKADGTPKGAYEPIVQLIAPQRNQLLSADLAYDHSQKFKVKSSFALSGFDQNTFSNLDAEDNRGWGSKTEVLAQDSVFGNKWLVGTNLIAEITSENFNAIERFRSVEFSRTWNRQLRNQNIGEGVSQQLNLGGAELFLKNNDLELKHKLSGIQFQEQNTGVQHLSKFSFTKNGWSVNALNDLTNTNTFIDSTSQSTSNFQIQNVSASYKKKQWLFSSSFNRENNQSYLPQNDSLLLSSFGFEAAKVRIEKRDSQENKFFTETRYRENRMPLGNGLTSESRSYDIESGFELISNPKRRVAITGTFRRLEFDETFHNDSAANNTLLSRAEYGLNLIKGFLQTNSYYQIGTGRERQFEVAYLFVGEGMGDYTWADVNDNGERELGEFRPEDFNGQGSYVRTVVNNNAYVQTVNNEFFQNITLFPAALWGAKKGIMGWLAKFQNQATGSIRRKMRDNNDPNQFNPFYLNLESPNLISTSAQVRNSLYFNRLNTNFGAEYTFIANTQKNLFVYGFEGQNLSEHNLQARIKLQQWLTAFPQYRDGQNISRSESLDEKNYNLDFNDLKLKMQVQQNNTWRFALNGSRYAGGDTQEDSLNQVVRNLLGIEAAYSIPGKGTLNGSFNYINVDYLGPTNTPISFNLLNGLRPGVNATWTLLVNFQISEQAQLSVNYEGRASQENSVIHNGSVNARWLF